MSKASEYANRRPKEIRAVGWAAWVDEYGFAIFRENNKEPLRIGPQDALKLRDWLTDTFDEVKP